MLAQQVFMATQSTQHRVPEFEQPAEGTVRGFIQLVLFALKCTPILHATYVLACGTPCGRGLLM